MTKNMTIRSLAKIVEDLEARVAKLEKRLSPKTAEIQRVEVFNGEVAPEPKDNMKMNEEDKLYSIQNAIAILPPNLMKDGRHSIGNVSAIVGFKVSEELLARAYEKAS